MKYDCEFEDTLKHIEAVLTNQVKDISLLFVYDFNPPHTCQMAGIPNPPWDDIIWTKSYRIIIWTYKQTVHEASGIQTN